MKTVHISSFAAAVAKRRGDTESAIAVRQDELDSARHTLGQTEETIRACRRELERLETFRILGVEHVQELEVELDRLRQYREGCDGILLDAEPARPKPGEQPRRRIMPADADPNAAGAADRFSKHLNNGAG